MNIFVGNLSFEVKEPDLHKVFAPFGKVESLAIVMDKNGKKSRGFAFVEMPDEPEALAAIATLQGKEILGRRINVLQALSKKKERPSAPLPLRRTGKYKEGRRTISYLKSRGLIAPSPEPKVKPNPLRWRKKSKWSTPYQKPEVESKRPWRKSSSPRSLLRHKK